MPRMDIHKLGLLGLRSFETFAETNEAVRIKSSR